MAASKKRVRSKLLARAQAKQPESRPQQVESPKRDTGPSVTRYEPEAPPWARPDWKPAASGPSTSEVLERHQRRQEFEALRARLGGGTDMFGHTDRPVPAGFDPLFGWKL